MLYEAARVAENVKKNERRRLERAIGARIAPLDGHDAYRRHWRQLISGEAQKARTVSLLLMHQVAGHVTIMGCGIHHQEGRHTRSTKTLQSSSSTVNKTASGGS
jgi:hypothetical protein